MTDRLYPTSLRELDSWREQHRTSSKEAQQRFVQFVILDSIAASARGREVAFKGGNALRFVHSNPRGTRDLDFSAEATFPDDKDKIRKWLDDALKRGGRRAGIKARCQAIKRNPPKGNATHPTYKINVGYQFETDRHSIDFETWDGNFSQVVPVEISINDVICETRDEQLAPDAGVTIRACVLEDIIAEKLRALLQQPIRGRNRKQDAYDIARFVRCDGARINTAKVANYLVCKAQARGIKPRKSSFDEHVREQASHEYGHLFQEHDPDFIRFDDAWETILAFVGQLNIPE